MIFDLFFGLLELWGRTRFRKRVLDRWLSSRVFEGISAGGTVEDVVELKLGKDRNLIAAGESLGRVIAITSGEVKTAFPMWHAVDVRSVVFRCEAREVTLLIPDVLVEPVRLEVGRN